MLLIIIQVIKRDLKYSFAGSTFGTIWLFLSPLLQTMVFYYLFEHIIEVRFPTEKTANMPYSAYLILGLAFWTGFVQALFKATNAIIDNRNFVKKVPIPPYVYVISACTVGFIYTPIVLLFSIPLLGINFIKIAINLLPIIVLWYIFALGLSILLASIAVYIRDVSQILGPALNFLFYSVPIIYPYSLVPEDIKPIIKLNPLFYMVEAIYLQTVEFNLKAIIFCLVIASIALVSGIFVYRYLSVGFLDVL